MKTWITSTVLIFVSGLAIARGLMPAAIEHSHSITQRPDGRFDVLCVDGKLENKSKEEVLANNVCGHLRTFTGRWPRIEGNSAFCDLDIHLIRSADGIAKLRAGFLSPCPTTAAVTQQCQGLTCSMQLNDRYYDFDFSVTNRLTLTRLEDSAKGVYRGNAGSGIGGNPGTTNTLRVTELGAIPNILQASIDGGNTWLSVCDDEFNERAAQVACRELGYSGLRDFNTGVTVFNDDDYGWDGLVCTGNEASLADCSHNRWTGHDCGVGEHVQLYCN